MANTVPTVTQGVTVYSFSVAKCEFKGCDTVSAVPQEPSKLPKACSGGRIQDDVQGEEQELWKSLRSTLRRMEVRLEGSKPLHSKTNYFVMTRYT